MKDGNLAEAKTCFIERASKNLLSSRGVAEILPEIPFKDAKTTVTQAEMLFGLLCDQEEEALKFDSDPVSLLSYIPLELVNEELIQAHCPPSTALAMFSHKKTPRKTRHLLLKLQED